jgi:hypothetical protein
MKKTTLVLVALGFPPRADNPSATWHLACFLLATVQTPGGALAWVLTGMTQR